MVPMAAFTFAVVFSLFGNLMLCQMFIRHPLVRLTAGRLLHQLAPVDLMWSLLALPFIVVLDSSEMMMGRILSFVFRLVHFFLSTGTITLAFVLLDLLQLILRPLTSGIMMIKHLMRVVVIWVLAIAVSFPRFIYQNLYLMSFEEKLWMFHLPDILDSDWLMVKIFKFMISAAYYLVPLLLTTKAFLIMMRVQLRIIAAEIRFLELEDVVLPLPNRRKTLVLLLALVAVFVISSFPLSFYVALIAGADAKTKNAVCSVCQWVALIKQRSALFAQYGPENSENVRPLEPEGEMPQKPL